MGLLSSIRSKAGMSKSESDWNSESSADEKNGSHKTTAPSSNFLATSNLDVHAIGYDTNQALTGSTLENISVHRVESGQTEYVSMRQKKSSNSCALVRSSDQDRTLISTIYRMGPGRHPKMHILPDNARVTVDAALQNKSIPGDEVEVKSRSFTSRAQVFDTALGKFQWRYGSREEKKACSADSLLVMERADDGTRIAQLIRNAELRTPGTVKYSGGNGGRLMIDLHEWENNDKGGAAGVEAFAVASCILMLKREAERFINNNVAAVV